MVHATRRSERLLVPLADNPRTNWRENVREQTFPASAPEGDSKLATAVLAVTLDPTLDSDADGFADGDNDKDGLVDEDPGGDNTFDGMPGIAEIDDNGDGVADAGQATNDKDNDEDGTPIDDWLDGLDNDGDGAIDEDIPAETNGDNKAGLADFDDDGDGAVDEGNNQNDDEDDAINEDWFDPVVFFLRGSTLFERRPNLDPRDGRDFSEYPIADNVTYFRVERVADAGKRAVLVDVTLELTVPDIEADSQERPSARWRWPVINTSSERGFILLAVLTLLTLLASVILVLSRESASGLTIGARELEVNAASLVAEAGLQHAVWKASSTGACSAYTDLVDVPFGEHAYSASYSKKAGSPVAIKAIGTLDSGATQTLLSANTPVYQEATTILLRPDAAEGTDTTILSSKSLTRTMAQPSSSRCPAQRHKRRSLLRFELGSLPTGTRIVSAVLELRSRQNLRQRQRDGASRHQRLGRRRGRR